MQPQDGRQNPTLSPSINNTPSTKASIPCRQDLVAFSSLPVVPPFSLGEPAMQTTNETYSTSFRTVTASPSKQNAPSIFTDSIQRNTARYTGLVKPKALRPNEITELQKGR